MEIPLKKQLNPFQVLCNPISVIFYTWWFSFVFFFAGPGKGNTFLSVFFAFNEKNFTMDIKSLFVFMSLWLIVSYILLDSVQSFEGPRRRRWQRRRRRRRGKRSENTRDYISSDEDKTLKSTFMIWVWNDISCFVSSFSFRFVVVVVSKFLIFQDFQVKRPGFFSPVKHASTLILNPAVSLSVRLKICIRAGLIFFPIIRTNFTSSDLKTRDLVVFAETGYVSE